MSTVSSNPRTIFFTEIEQFGGAERAAVALCRYLTDRNLDCQVATYEDRCGLSTYSSFPLRVVQLHPTSGVAAKVRALRKFFLPQFGAAMHPLLSGYQPALHASLAGMRGFHDLMHDTPALFDDPHRHTIKERLRRMVSNQIIGFGLRSGGNTIVTSEFLRDECRKDFRVAAHIARMGGFTEAVTQPFIPRPPHPDQRLSMLSVCRLEENKRLDWLLRGLARLESSPASPLSRLVDWHLDFVGKGPQLDTLRQLAASLGIAHRVNFQGFVADDALAELYARADLFLMPAIQGYGIPAIEALGRGIPVLLHRDSGVSDILVDTPWATVLHGGEANTAATLANAIDGILTGRHLSVPLPDLPTEDAWAHRVASLCGWLPDHPL